MKIVVKTLLLVCFLISGSLSYSADQAKSIKSPDGEFAARITMIQKATQGPPEFIIEMIDSGGKIAAKKDFTSEDGEHGLSIDEAEWTPDSQFFIFATYSSGGHMAWQFRTFFLVSLIERFTPSAITYLRWPNLHSLSRSRTSSR